MISLRRKIVAQRYSLFAFGCTGFISHGNFLTDPRGNISHWRGIGFRPRIRGTRREPGNVRKGVANALLSPPVCERSDSTHVTIINSDYSMGMYIFACKREKCVRQRVLRLSRWQIQITSTKTPLPVYSKPHLGTGDENSPKRFLIYMYTCMYPRQIAIRSRIPALLNWKSRKEIDCGWYARIRKIRGFVSEMFYRSFV